MKVLGVSACTRHMPPEEGVYRFHTKLGLITIEPNHDRWRAMWYGHKYQGEPCCLNSVARSPHESAAQASEWLEAVQEALRANGLVVLRSDHK
jgi:hypothetical protein